MKTPTPLEIHDNGQIRPGSPFGDALTALARQSDTIVETGAWHGLGSTYCLYLGMTEPHQRLTSVELDRRCYEMSSARYADDPRVTILWGTIVKPEEVPPFAHPDPALKSQYDGEIEANRTAPYVYDQLPSNIDLLLLDSGCWTGEAEFNALWYKSRIIALDDTNPATEIKHVKTRAVLIEKGWEILYDRQDDRNGWAIFRRP